MKDLLKKMNWQITSKNLIIFLLFLFIPFFLAACQKTEERAVTVEKKTVEPLPPISQDRISLWIEVARDIGSYIRKVSLEEEEVYEKRTLVMIAHSSSRTELEYSKIFKDKGMTSKEFWYIVDQMSDVQKYLDIKAEELQQARELDSLINSGVDELKVLQRNLDREKSPEKKKSISAKIKSMEEKINEFRSYKANISPEEVKIDPLLIELWKKNKEKYESALAAMWKRNSAAPARKSYQHM